MKLWLLAAVLGGALSVGSESVAVKVGDMAPNFEGTWLNHPDASLADLSGRIVFIEVWRTW